MAIPELRPLQRVRVRSLLDYGSEQVPTAVEGTVVSREAVETNAPFAAGKNGQFWIDRLVLRKDSGELTSVVINEHTKVDVLNG